MNKILMTATYGDFFAAFEVDNIKILNNLGYKVYLCADWHSKEFNYKHDKLNGLDFEKIDINFFRSPINIKNIANIISLFKIIKKNEINYVEANNPVVGVITRVAARMANVRNITYIAHGFQFCENGPKKDWILYYPIEWLLSFWTKTLIVINQEDYLFAKSHLHSDEVLKIPGVGLNTKNFFRISEMQKSSLRYRYKIKENNFVILSVGELSYRKNVLTAIKATEVALRKDQNVVLLIVGVGELMDKLRFYVKQKKLESNIIFLGKRKDIFELNGISDVCIFPSFREGLAIAPLESMAMGLPLISSRARGVMEYSDNGKTGFNFNAEDYARMGNAIIQLKRDKYMYGRFSNNAIKRVREFSLDKTNEIMKKHYLELLGR